MNAERFGRSVKVQPALPERCNQLAVGVGQEDIVYRLLFFTNQCLGKSHLFAGENVRNAGNNHRLSWRDRRRRRMVARVKSRHRTALPWPTSPTESGTRPAAGEITGSLPLVPEPLGKRDGDYQPHGADQVAAPDVADIMFAKVYPAETDGQDQEKRREKDVDRRLPASGKTHQQVGRKTVKGDGYGCVAAWKRKGVFGIDGHCRSGTVKKQLPHPGKGLTAGDRDEERENAVLFAPQPEQRRGGQDEDQDDLGFAEHGDPRENPGQGRGAKDKKEIGHSDVRSYDGIGGDQVFDDATEQGQHINKGQRQK